MAVEINGLSGSKTTSPSIMGILTVVLLTRNEEIHIERCLRSLAKVAKKIFIVDFFSTDKTVQIARSLGAEVVQHPWKNYADQFQWGLEHCETDLQWLMRMDADEYLENDLQEELPALLNSLSPDVEGVYIKRKVFFMGKWIHYGGFYPHILLRVWRTGKGRIEQRWMDEHIVLYPGAKTVMAQGHLVDDNRKGVTFWIDKHNKYASREMVDLLNIKYPLFDKDEGLKAIDDPQARRKRIIKERIYSKLPIGLRALLYFFYRYFLRLGFLDGRIGLIYHFMQGFWYRFLVDVKVMEIEKMSGGDLMKLKQLINEKHGIEI